MTPAPPVPEVGGILRSHDVDTARPDPAHRVATISFMRFSGTDQILEEEGPDELARRLHETLRIAQEAFIAEDVALLCVDCDVGRSLCRGLVGHGLGGSGRSGGSRSPGQLRGISRCGSAQGIDGANRLRGRSSEQRSGLHKR